MSQQSHSKSSIVKFEIVEILKNVNNNDLEAIINNTYTLLQYYWNDMMQYMDEEVELLTAFYQLIFHAYTQNPKLAYNMLCGILTFSRTAEGSNYKPLLDHLVIEAFDKFIEEDGWVVLRDFVNSLYYHLPAMESEPLFMHMMTRIIKQLYEDECQVENNEPVSDICHHLPREKSFVWGWFASFVASAYFDTSADSTVYSIVPAYYHKRNKRTQLMHYRKLITKLRQIADTFVPNANTEEGKTPTMFVKESWAGMLTVFSAEQYQWGAELIKHLMSKPVDVEPVAVVTPKEEVADLKEEVAAAPKEEVVAAPKEEVAAAPKEEVAVVAPKEEVQPVDVQPVVDADLPILVESLSILEKKEVLNNNTSSNKSWFSWLGWA